tara:strand:+ start:12028 stop:13113 length:1086 start_codon:yes stop_codon:yes gene_type:complete
MGLFDKGTTVEAQEPVDVKQSIIDYVQGVNQSLNTVINVEKRGRPEFLKLELADIEGSIFGVDGQRGILDITRDAGEVVAEEEIKQKERDLETLDEFGTGVAERLRGLADPDADRLARAQADQAMSLYETAERGPSPEQIRNITQGVLGGTQASQLDDPSTLANQFLARDQFTRLNREEARKAGAMAFNQAQTLGGDPLKFLFGDPSQALRYGTSTYGQGFQLAQTEQGPQLVNMDTGLNLALEQRAQDTTLAGIQAQNEAQGAAGIMGLAGNVLGAAGMAAGGGTGASILTGLGLGCWVAREVYGVTNPDWLLFRNWLFNYSPSWFRKIYLKHGEKFAKFISNKPILKNIIRSWMNTKLK